MKKGLRTLWCLLLVVLLAGAYGICACAVSISDTEEAAVNPVISYGLNVIANETDMRVAGISGQTFNFSEKHFMRAMNLSDIESIQITQLPSDVQGAIYCGAQRMKAGQTVIGDNIDKMTFSQAEGFSEYASFKFRVNGSSYENECKIYMLKSVNSCPSTANASYASLNIDAYRNISVSGVLAGYDADGDGITFEIVRYPEDGAVRILDRKHGTYTYIPSENYSGKDSFEYVVRDCYGNYSASAKVSVTVAVPSVSVVYSDLVDSDIYSYAINLTEQGVMNGIQVGEHFYFRPEASVSRAEFVVTAMSALGIKNVPDVKDTGFYDDGSIRDEMKGYIALAYSKGYISGIRKDGEIYFCPNDEIKLSEAAVILSNIIGYSDPEIKPVFSDASSIPAWSQRAVVSLYSLGVLESGDGNVEVNRTVDRGTMAKILSRAMVIGGV